MNTTTNIHISDTNVPVTFRTNPITDSIVTISFGPDHIHGLSIVLDRRTLSNLRRALADYTATERNPANV